MRKVPQAKVIDIEKTIGGESEKIINVNCFPDFAKRYYNIQKNLIVRLYASS